MKPRTIRHAALTVWVILICVSLFWNIHLSRESYQQINLETARSFFELIVTTRAWNAMHDGVYVPVTEGVQPNPYLDLEGRDIQLEDDTLLTQINPAYMTRLISELAEENNLVQFHITSLNPIRPENAPNQWETAAMQSFENEQSEEFYFWDENETFYYMAPLYTTEGCLKCHAQQGYQIGDVRGGISVHFNSEPGSLGPMIISHLGIGFAGFVLIMILGSKLENVFSELENRSLIDGLTQVHNRRFFDEYLKREYLISRRKHSPLSVILCDIDFFKRYNDLYGHPAGDECLKQVAKKIEKNAAPSGRPVGALRGRGIWRDPSGHEHGRRAGDRRTSARENRGPQNPA